MGPGEPDDTAGFWRALGFDPSKIPAHERAEKLELLAEALRETAAGLVKVLSGRKSMKDEFRIDQTRLAAVENNPFKFFTSGDEVLRRILVEDRPGYLPLDMAIRQGFADIQLHEVTTASALQSGLRRVLALLAPAAIEKEVGPGAFGRKPDRSKSWDRYAALHAETTRDVDRILREVLAEEFGKAVAAGQQRGAGRA